MKGNEVILKEAFSGDYDRTISLLLEVFSGSYNWTNKQRETFKDFYKGLFSGKWNNGSEKHIGYILENTEGEVVGFVGYIYTQRIIGGINYKFCNLSSWAVKEPYRRDSLELMYPIQDKPDYIYTNFSPNETAVKVWTKLLKAKQLESQMYAVLAIPSFLIFKNLKSYFDDAILSNFLDQEEYKLLQDHKSISKATFLLLKNNKGEKCLISATISIRKKYLRFSQINYISNTDFFKTHFKTINWLLSKRLLTVGSLIDKRFLGDFKPKYATTYPSIKFFLAKNLQSPANIDHLYSECYL